MNKEYILTLLKENDLKITFTKKSTGETRVMNCTLNFPKEFASKLFSDENVLKEKPEDLVTVFDIDNGGWRSFLASTVTDIKVSDKQFTYLK